MMTGHSNTDFTQKAFLVVDDFPGMRSMMRDILRGCGVDSKSIDVAASGNEAIRLLEGKRYDVVLCDFNLGAGKNGQQVLEEAKHRQLVGPACAWMIVTAEKTSDAVTGTAEYLPDAYLIKPITEAALRMRLERIWAKKRAFADIDEALSRRKIEQAIRLCDVQMKNDKANAFELLRLKCQLLLASGDLAQARQGYEQVQAVRDTPWAKVGIAKVLFHGNDLAGARQLLEEVIADSRTYLEAYDWLAKTLQAMGEMEACEAILERAAKLSPNSVVRQKTLGDVSLKLGKLEEAEGAFRKSVSLGEFSVFKTPDAYLGLARTCSARQSPEEALRVLQTLNKAFAQDEVHLKSLAVEGQIHLQSGNSEAADQAVQEMGALMEKGEVRPDTDTTLEMARLMLATDHREKAVELLKDEIRNNPENALLLASVQQVFNDAGMREEGQTIVAVSRQEAMEMMNRGVLLVRDDKLDEAVVWMRNAHHMLPKNLRVLFNFAQVLLTKMEREGAAKNLVDEARACLEAASPLAPHDRRLGTMLDALEKLAPSLPEKGDVDL